MSFKVGLAQTGYPADGDVAAQALRFAEEAADAGCRLIMFPEDFMWPRRLNRTEVAELAQPENGAFVQAMVRIARECGIWMLFTMNECNPAGGAPFNTAVVVDDAGTVRASYRKCHLYDALGQRESDLLTPGDALPGPVCAPFATIGLQICYDLRFPEAARSLAIAGCNLVAYPAAWHDGPCKADQWETLLKARAVENELFVAGVCRAGQGFAGHSMLVDPMGRVAARTEGSGEALVVGEVDLGLLQETRRNMPIFSHRRPGLYGTVAREA